MLVLSDIRGARTGLAEKIEAKIQSWNAFKRRREIRDRTYRELSALNDRDLADLGISRYDIGAIADEAARAA